MNMARYKVTRIVMETYEVVASTCDEARDLATDPNTIRLIEEFVTEMEIVQH